MQKTLYVHGMPQEAAQYALEHASLTLDNQFHKLLGIHPAFTKSPNKNMLIPIQIALEKLEWPEGIEPIREARTTRFGKNIYAKGTKENLAKAIEYTLRIPVHNPNELLPNAGHHYAWRGYTANGKLVLLIDRRISQPHSFVLSRKLLDAYLELMKEREELMPKVNKPKSKGN